MKITFSCPQCKQTYQTTITAAYFSFRCHKCPQIIKVPDKSDMSQIICLDAADIMCNRTVKEGKTYTYNPYKTKEPYYSYSDGYCQ